MKSLILTAFALAYSCTPVAAQQNCSSYNSFLKLWIEHKAERKLRYASNGGWYVEAWVAPDGEIMVIRTLDGHACILDSGFTAETPA